jgi:hypothetical protein
MSDVTLDQVYELAEQLSAADRAQLIARLQAQFSGKRTDSVTRETILAEHARLKAAGAFDKPTSLRNMYARPDLDLSFDSLQADLREFSTEWEQEIDEFFADD